MQYTQVFRAPKISLRTAVSPSLAPTAGNFFWYTCIGQRKEVTRGGDERQTVCDLRSFKGVVLGITVTFRDDGGAFVHDTVFKRMNIRYNGTDDEHESVFDWTTGDRCLFGGPDPEGVPLYSRTYDSVSGIQRRLTGSKDPPKNLHSLCMCRMNTVDLVIDWCVDAPVGVTVSIETRGLQVQLCRPGCMINLYVS
jgi:hypothetical protein